MTQDSHENAELIRRCEKIFARSTLIKCPLVNEEGAPTNILKQALFVPFNRTTSAAGNEEQDMNLLLMSNRLHRFSNRKDTLRPSVDVDDERVQTILELLREENPSLASMPDRKAIHTLTFHKTNPPEYAIYHLSYDPEVFEEKYGNNVVRTIAPSNGVISAFFNRMVEERRTVVSLMGDEPLLASHFERLAEEHPELKGKFAHFIVEGDTPNVAGEATVSILPSHEVVNDLITDEAMVAIVQQNLDINRLKRQ